MIVGRSEDYTSSDPTLNPLIEEGQLNPIRRDTVQIPSMHSATLRFVADNPGVWFFHCAFSVCFLPVQAFLMRTISFKATSNGIWKPDWRCS